MYFYTNDVFKLQKNKTISQRRVGNYSVNQEYLKQQNLKVELLGRGFAWLDTGTHDSLMEAGQFIETIEKRQGLKVACLEEIAFRMKYIDKPQLKKLAEPLKKNGYGQYLIKISKDKMKFIKTEISDVYIIEPSVFGDNRGYFLESYN